MLIAQASWPEVWPRLEAGAVAVLPFGAAAKQHGPHLPMDTDYLQAEWLGRAVSERLDAVVWPTVGYGHYPAFTGYPGSCSLSRETFTAMAAEILACLRDAGAGTIALLNTGLSTIAPLREAVACCPLAGHTTLINVYEGPRYRRTVADIEQQRHGGHADELETSIMLAIAPESVDMDRVGSWDHVSVQGRFSRTDPASAGYSPDGITGNPSLATPGKGRRLLEAMLEDITEAIVRLRAASGAVPR